jgi:hypothetical protein
MRASAVGAPVVAPPPARSVSAPQRWQEVIVISSDEEEEKIHTSFRTPDVRERKGQDDIPQMPPPLLCPIMKTLMKDPVSIADGSTYERSAIERWLQQHGRSPLTNLPLTHRVIVPNVALKNVIEDFLLSQQRPTQSVSEPWECDTCTFINKGTMLDACTVCETPKSKKRKLFSS